MKHKQLNISVHINHHIKLQKKANIPSYVIRDYQERFFSFQKAFDHPNNPEIKVKYSFENILLTTDMIVRM